MDALIALFVIIAIFNALGPSRKKKERQARRRAFPQAEQARQSREPVPPAQRAQARREKRAAVEAHRVRTDEELQAHLAAMEAASGRADPWQDAWDAAASGEGAPQEARARRRESPRPAEPRVAAPGAAPRASRGGEGEFSTQGESEAEHAEHRRRAEAEEQAHRLAREALLDLREARREKLQNAVIMSEILNKPVSLRPRAGLHR